MWLDSSVVECSHGKRETLGFHGNNNVFLEEGCSYKIDHIATVARPMPLSLVSLLSLDIFLFFCGK